MLSPEKISQLTRARWGWNTRIAPLEEMLARGPDYQSVDSIPDEFKRRLIEIAGENASLMTRLFEGITSREAKIGSGGYAPFIYDTRDSNHPQVVGLKMSGKGAWRLAQIRLGLPPEGKHIILTVENFRLYGKQREPAAVISADDKAVKVKRNEDLQSVVEEKQWLDAEFHQWLDDVIAQLSTVPSAAS